MAYLKQLATSTNMYVLNIDDPNTRCLLVTGCKELDTVVRFMTREGIWLNSLYWIDNLGWYQVCYSFGPGIYVNDMRGKNVRQFYDICRTDGGTMLSIVPLDAHARR